MRTRIRTQKNLIPGAACMTADCQHTQEYVVFIHRAPAISSNSPGALGHSNSPGALGLEHHTRVTFCAACVSRWHKFIMGDRLN